MGMLGRLFNMITKSAVMDNDTPSFEASDVDQDVPLLSQDALAVDFDDDEF